MDLLTHEGIQNGIMKILEITLRGNEPRGSITTSITKTYILYHNRDFLLASNLHL
jgi:hypothetical protein